MRGGEVLGGRADRRALVTRRAGPPSLRRARKPDRPRRSHPASLQALLASADTPEVSAHENPAEGSGARQRPLDLLLAAAGDFRALVERLPLIVYVDAPDAGSPGLYVSAQTTVVLGYSPEDWVSTPEFFQSILHPEDRERVVAATADMLAGGAQSPLEYRVLRRDGSLAWIRDEGVLVRDEAGRPLCTQGYMLDVTERKEREAALRQSEARMRAMLGAALDGVITIDADGMIIEFNAAAECMFGYAREAAVGRKMVDLIVPPGISSSTPTSRSARSRWTSRSRRSTRPSSECWGTPATSSSAP
ncbi:MAG: hypothetical protein QOI71_2136, partial [Gaiellales bacterium]|nr:hypothetical protein [Gaiellales bacterium]